MIITRMALVLVPSGPEGGEHVGVVLQGFAQDRVDGLPTGLQVNEQCAFGTPGINTPAILLHALAQRVEIKRLQGALRFHFGAVMGHQELAINKIDIGLDAAEAVVEGVEQGRLCS